MDILRSSSITTGTFRMNNNKKTTNSKGCSGEQKRKRDEHKVQNTMFKKSTINIWRQNVPKLVC